jgi:hypothetical protein
VCCVLVLAAVVVVAAAAALTLLLGFPFAFVFFGGELSNNIVRTVRSES